MIFLYDMKESVVATAWEYATEGERNMIYSVLRNAPGTPPDFAICKGRIVDNITLIEAGSDLCPGCKHDSAHFYGDGKCKR
jgi:hypothetical protein